MDKVSLADNYFLGILNRQRSIDVNDGITKISGLLLRRDNFGKVKEYACQANMSVRNFERRFTEQVGISPKLFTRLFRFNCAFRSKMYDPLRSWPDIASELGYYDTLHLIKEFKEFAKASPAALFKLNPVFSTVG